MEQITKEIEEQASSPQTNSSRRELAEAEHKTEIPCGNDDDEELNIASEHFNPLKALYDPNYRVTEKQPKIIYQNMAAFETALKKFGIMGLNKKPKTNLAADSKDNKNPLLVEEERTQRRFQEHQMAIRTQAKVKQKHQRNILIQMAQSEGPIKQLQQFVKESRRIRVLVRKEHGIKGYIEGELKMFDRHWNLLLTDVLECLEQRKYKYAEDNLVNHQQPEDCSYVLDQLGITLPQQSVKSLSRKRVEVKRHLPQLLLRGEQVVLISAKGST
ncbi:U7 snRNA-associated Sm-like protein LSm11 [Lucilia cuprina]|uniref:U7 snRNA-associated Sm-like protein LSm11 n=1 Tax=Lucilia cuprina TaxID=7375 RepID=UPI001F06B942|nr:U7 snRNA-associated Sm-like protein LSm11 [Lucilia cuprina]